VAISRCLDKLSPREEQVLRLRFGVSDVQDLNNYPEQLFTGENNNG
jgi:DNA-directed RNA polymerase sigma subunit (sigma70/sigma32)